MTVFDGVEVAGDVGDPQFRQQPARVRIELLHHEGDLLGGAKVHHAFERLAVVKVGVGAERLVAVGHLVALRVAVGAGGAVVEAEADAVAAVVDPGDLLLTFK